MNPDPHTAAEWAKETVKKWNPAFYATPFVGLPELEASIVDTLDAYARQRVEAALELAAQHLENASYLAQSEYLHNVLKSHAAAIRALPP